MTVVGPRQMCRNRSSAVRATALGMPLAGGELAALEEG